MTAPKYSKERTICKMCRRIANLDENHRCYICAEIAIKRKNDYIDYKIQLRKSMGLS